jgi:hypothetical protein
LFAAGCTDDSADASAQEPAALIMGEAAQVDACNGCAMIEAKARQILLLLCCSMREATTADSQQW